jgi:hypothetical protein
MNNKSTASRGKRPHPLSRYITVLLAGMALSLSPPFNAATKPASAEKAGAVSTRVPLGNIQVKQLISLTDLACVLSDAGKVFCWEPDNRIAAEKIRVTQVDLGPNGVAKRIYGQGQSTGNLATGYHGCAVLSDASIRCWTSKKRNLDDVVLGADDLFDLTNPTKATAPSALGSYRVKKTVLDKLNPHATLFVTAYSLCSHQNETGLYCTADALKYLNGKKGVGDIITGESMDCLRFESGNVECYNHAPTATHVLFGKETDIRIISRDYYPHQDICAVTGDNKVVCGAPSKQDEDQLPGGTLHMQVKSAQFSMDDKIVFLSAVSGNTCILFASGKANCWGRNGSRQIDSANSGEILFPGVHVDLGSDTKIISMAIAPGYGCYLLEDNRVICRGHAN